MEVQPVEKNNNNLTPPPASSPPSWTAISVQDALVSVGKTVSWGFWSFCRYSFSFISSYFWKKEEVGATADLIDVATPAKARETFLNAPFSVIMKIIDAIHDDPITAEKLVKMFAQIYMENPENSPYRGDTKQSYNFRKEWIMAVDELVIKCILSPKLYLVDERACMGEMEEDEAWAISNDPKTERGREFRKLYDEAQSCKKKFTEIWSTLLEQLDVDLPHLDLTKDYKHVNPVPKEVKTFGVFLERLIFKMDTSADSARKLTDLLDREVFDPLADYVADQLRFVIQQKPTAQIHLLCSRLLAILDDKSKRKILFNITAGAIGIFRPMKG